MRPDFRRRVPWDVKEINFAFGYVAGIPEPSYYENPEQVPAYRYPREYGPRAPGFCRASAIESEKEKIVFVSGTSSIKGSSTMGAQNVIEQTAVTIDNLNKICDETGLNLYADEELARHYKIYLRNPGDMNAVKNELNHRLLKTEDSVMWVKGDICRKELLIEIELTGIAPLKP